MKCFNFGLKFNSRLDVIHIFLNLLLMCRYTAVIYNFFNKATQVIQGDSQLDIFTLRAYSMAHSWSEMSLCLILKGCGFICT
jgi:hypothetical protein